MTETNKNVKNTFKQIFHLTAKTQRNTQRALNEFLIEAALGIERKYFYCHFAIKDCSESPAR